jgi:hypothetical protein
MAVLILELKEMSRSDKEARLESVPNQYRKIKGHKHIFTLNPHDSEYKQDSANFPMKIKNFIVNVEFHKVFARDIANCIGFINSKQKRGTIFMTKELMKALEIERLVGFKLRFEFEHHHPGTPELLFLGIDSLYGKGT